MNVLILTSDLSWFYLAIFNGALLSSLNYFAKDKLQNLLDESLLLIIAVFSSVIFLLGGKYSLAFLAFIFSGIALEKIIRKKEYKIQKKDIYWRPIFVSCLFICSYVLGVVILHLNMPWFLGYFLPMFCFLFGLLIYKKTN